METAITALIWVIIAWLVWPVVLFVGVLIVIAIIAFIDTWRDASRKKAVERKKDNG